MFSCESCDQTFTRRSNLYRHQRESCKSRRTINGQGAKRIKLDDGASTSGTATTTCIECDVSVPTNRMAAHCRTLEHKVNSCVPITEGVALVRSAFKNRIATYRVNGVNGVNINDFKQFFGGVQEKVVNIMEESVEQHKSTKVNMEVFARYILPTSGNVDVKSFNTSNLIIDQGTDLHSSYNVFIDGMIAQTTEFSEKDSDSACSNGNMVLLVEDSHDEKRPILNSSNEFSQINLNTGAKSIDLQSKEAHHIIDLLVTAITQNDTSMITNCTEVLTRKINKDNALDCLGRLKLISTITHDFEPSAPPPGILGKKDSGESQNKDWISDLEDNLRNLCLLEIDKNADYILKKRDLLGLDYGDLFNITTRDTLQVSSELVVYSAVMRWAVAQQRRKEAKGEELNLRNTLQELIYAPRYGLMSKNEFLIRTIDDIQGPDRSGILKESEIQDILSYIKKKSKNQTVQPLPYKGSQPRKRRNSSENTSLNPVCEKHLLNFLTCWTAVFD